MLGLSVFHVLVLIGVLVSIVLPFLLVAHAQHARALITTVMLLTIVMLVLFLLFGHAPERVDQVLLRCYAFSSALCSLADELLSMRDETTPMRVIVALLLFFLFLFSLVCLIGGVSGKF